MGYPYELQIDLQKGYGNNLDKRVSRDARKAASIVFKIGSALIGCALGLILLPGDQSLQELEEKDLKDDNNVVN